MKVIFGEPVRVEPSPPRNTVSLTFRYQHQPTGDLVSRQVCMPYQWPASGKAADDIRCALKVAAALRDNLDTVSGEGRHTAVPRLEALLPEESESAVSDWYYKIMYATCPGPWFTLAGVALHYFDAAGHKLHIPLNFEYGS